MRGPIGNLLNGFQRLEELTPVSRRRNLSPGFKSKLAVQKRQAEEKKQVQVKEVKLLQQIGKIEMKVWLLR
jgi:hypothetical protein